jgi:hypothetical protein
LKVGLLLVLDQQSFDPEVGERGEKRTEDERTQTEGNEEAKSKTPAAH